MPEDQNRLKIGIVMPLAQQRGGAEMLLLHLLRANCRLSPSEQIHYHLAFLEDGPMLREARRLGYRTRLIRSGRLREAGRYLSTVLRLRRWIRQESLQLVMSWMATGQLYACPAALMARVPAVWWLHSVIEGDRMDRIVTRLPARAIFCCSRAAQESQSHLKPLRPMRVIHPAVDLERYTPDALPSVTQTRRQLGLPQEGRLIGIVARLQTWKGIHVFLDAAALVAAHNPRAAFVVVGGGHDLEAEYEARLHEQSHALGLSEKVRFVGYQTDTALWMQAMDVVAHASTKPEGFGMVVIEAMALGKITVAARAGGPLEIIEDGTDGLLAAPGNAAELAGAIERALQENPANAAMRAAARRKAATFGTDRFAQSVAHHAREMVSGAAGTIAHFP